MWAEYNCTSLQMFTKYICEFSKETLLFLLSQFYFITLWQSTCYYNNDHEVVYEIAGEETFWIPSELLVSNLN